MPKHQRFKAPLHDEGRKPWDIQDGEPIIWYQRFEKYRTLGVHRSLEKLWQSLPGPHGLNVPNRWYQIANDYNWRDRAAAWDVFQIAEKRREFADEAQEDKRTRLRIIKGARNKLLQALDQLDPSTAKFPEVFSALKVVMDELRSEYDDQPTQRHKLSENEANIAITDGLARLASRRQIATDLEDREGISYPFIDVVPTVRDEELQEER